MSIKTHDFPITRRVWWAAIFFTAVPLTGQVGGPWIPEGPAPTAFGQVENVFPNDEVVGAIHTVTPHPTDPDVLIVGSVNGGIWKTDDARAASPSWRQTTDRQDSLSISAVEYDPFDASHRTLVAGIGTYSAYGFLGGQLTGLLGSRDGGESWKPLAGSSALSGILVSGVAPRRRTIVASAGFSRLPGGAGTGVWRSTDNGNSFSQVSLGDGSTTGLPAGRSFDLAGDPQDRKRLFTSLLNAEPTGGVNGVYRSDDVGASWLKVSDAAIDALLSSAATVNVEIAVGHHGEVYVAIVNGGSLAGLFRSGNGGGTWTAMDLPTTLEPDPIGIHPGLQGLFHLSIVADPTDADVVYVGGDRQPLFNEQQPAANSFPNSIGAEDFSGRLFRGDASRPPGSQFVHLTHSSGLGAAGGGTASSSAPHADSREMAFDAAGDLIEGDDGGVYRRTSPRDNTGDWLSLNGDLQVTELHDAAYDTLGDVSIGGAQDTGTPYQLVPGDRTWADLLTGDGGDVAVETTSAPGFSVRYLSFQGLQFFVRTFWDANNSLVGFAFPSLTVLGGGAQLVGQFTTPVELNGVDPTRLVIGAANSVYESLDQGDTITEVGPGLVVNGLGRDPIAYGAGGNPEALYVGVGDNVYARTAAHPAPLVASTTFPAIGSGETVRDLVLDPADDDALYAVSTTGVFGTQDGGATWSTLTGNLTSLADTPLRAIVYVESAKGDALAVGASDGVFLATAAEGFSVWRRLGSGLPNALVFDLDYDPADDVLLAGTMGRGAWTLARVAAEAISDELIGTFQNDGRVVAIATATGEAATLLTSGLFTVSAAARGSGDQLYLAKTAGGGNLYVTDLGTGVTTFVGPFTGGATNVQAMDFAPPAAAAHGFTPGTLYAISINGLGGCNPNCLFEVDAASGAATPIAGLQVNQGRGMSFHPLTGELWVFDQGGRNLYTVDAAGQARLQFNVPASDQQSGTGVGTVFSLAHSCDGDLFAVDVSHRVLVRIDLDQQQAFWVGARGSVSGPGPLQGLDGGTLGCGL